MRNVLLGWASGVTDGEAHAVASGLTDILSIARQTNVPQILGGSWVIDGCVQKLLGTPVPQGAQQPVEDLYYALVGSLAEDKSEGFDALSAKYIVVAIVDVDLTDSAADWIFGATKTNLVPISMISVVRPRATRSAITMTTSWRHALAVRLEPYARFPSKPAPRARDGGRLALAGALAWRRCSKCASPRSSR